MDKSRVQQMKEFFTLAKEELNNGDIGYTLSDEKHHIYVYVDQIDDDMVYVMEPNRVVDGAHEPIGGNTYIVPYNAFDELLIGFEWCVEQFEQDLEREVATKGYSSWKPYNLSCEECENVVDAALESIRGVGVAAGSGYYGLKSFSVGGEQFNLYCEICKLSDETTGELSYSVYYAVEFDEGDNLFCDWKEIEDLDVTALKKVVYEIASFDYAPDVMKHLESVKEQEQLENVVDAEPTHKGDKELVDGSFKYWSNACGDLHRNGNEFITEAELPEPLKRAYKELWGETWGSLCYLVETPDGYGVALVNEYDDYTASVKKCSKEDLFELVQADKELVMATSGFENAKVYAGDYTGFDECHELIVVFPADTPFEEFDSAANALEHIAYSSWFEKEKLPALENTIKAAESISAKLPKPVENQDRGFSI